MLEQKINVNVCIKALHRLTIIMYCKKASSLRPSFPHVLNCSALASRKMRALSKYLSERTPSLVVFCLGLEPRLHRLELCSGIREAPANWPDSVILSLFLLGRLEEKQRMYTSSKPPWDLKGQNHKNQTKPPANVVASNKTRYVCGR